MKLFLRLIAAVISICIAASPVYAAASPSVPSSGAHLADISGIPGIATPPDLGDQAIILIEAKSGAVLYAHDADTAYYPASITKIMTALLVLENCDLDDIVTFSYRATHELEVGSSSIARTEGEQLSVRECLYALLVASANEVAQALAEHVSGSFEEFAVLMNKRAEELGCTGTHFSNPSGLNDPNHYTTCRDMALILRAAIAHPDFLEIASTTSHVIPATNKHSEPIGVFMKHELLRGSDKYEYARCGKTGYTSLAGYTLATYASKDNIDLICITLNCESSEQRSSATKALFDYGFSNFNIFNVIESDTAMLANKALIQDESFMGGNLLDLKIADDTFIVLPEGIPFDKLTGTFKWNVENSSDRIASIEYRYGSTVVGYADLIFTGSSNDPYDFLRHDTYPDSYIKEVDESMPTWLIILISVAGVGVVILIYKGISYFLNGKYKKRRGARLSKHLR